MFNNVLNGIQWSQMVLNGLNKIDHKFNRMAFIAKFNLVLVWSKTVQIVTKKSSKWVRHNQVSWSSFEYVWFGWHWGLEKSLTLSHVKKQIFYIFF